MKDADDLPSQLQSQQSFPILFQKLFLFKVSRLCCRHQRHQNLSCFRRLPNQKMAQVSFMAQSVIKCHRNSLFLFFLKKILRSTQNAAIILIYNLTTGHGHNIVKAAALVHAKRKRPILHLISKRELHLVAVFIDRRTFLDFLPDTGCFLLSQNIFQKPVNLFLFYFRLLLIGKR